MSRGRARRHGGRRWPRQSSSHGSDTPTQGLEVVVGYPYFESIRSLGDRRRYSREPVTGFLGSDWTRIQFGSLELRDHQGDTGGPCLHEAGGAPTLAGISARGLGKEPTCTGTDAYREWIEREIELAAAAKVIEREEPLAQDDEEP